MFADDLLSNSLNKTTTRTHTNREKRVRIAENDDGITDSRNDVTTDINANVDVGSIQRKRTAWATAVGHQRVTLSELNKRSEIMRLP